MKTFLLVIVLGGLLVATLIGVVAVWTSMGDSPLSGHGVAAMVLGAVASLALGVGLMSLVFYSSRRGYDEDATGR